MMIIKKAAGLMTREEAEQLNEACNIYLIKENRLYSYIEYINNLGFFTDMDEAMTKLHRLMQTDKSYEKIELDPEKDLNRSLEFYTIDPQDYNLIMTTFRKIGKKLPIFQVVQMGAEFDLDNLVILIPLPTGLGNMDPVFKSSIATKFMKTQDRYNNKYINTVNEGEISFHGGLGAYSTGFYDLQKGRVFGAYDFKPIMDKVSSHVSKFNLDAAFLANGRMFKLKSLFGENSSSSSAYSSAVIFDLTSLEQKYNKSRALKLNLNYDFLDNYFSPELKKEMLRKIRRFINRRGGSKDKNFNMYLRNSGIVLRDYPYFAIAIKTSNSEHSFSYLDAYLERLFKLDIGEETYSLPEEIEEAIVDKLGVGLLNYFENNGLTRPIQTLRGEANRFRSVVIRSIVDDAIASSLPGFSQPSGKQRGFTLEKSYTGMPQTLKDLTSLSTFNELLRVAGEAPTYITLEKRERMYLEELKKALNEMTDYLGGENFKKFSDVSSNYYFRFKVDSDFKQTGPYKLNYVVKIEDKSDTDISMSAVFDFKFSLPDFKSSSITNLTLEEVDVERYMVKTSKNRYTVDINKIEDLNLEIADTIRRIFEPRNFFSNEEMLQEREPVSPEEEEEGIKGARLTSPTLTAKGLFKKIFMEESAKPDVIVLQDLVIDNLTGRTLGVLFYPGLTGSGFYLSVDDRKSGLVRTRPEKGEIFVVCSGTIQLRIPESNVYVTDSVCSYAQSRNDFESSMDSAGTAFLLAGGVRGTDLSSMKFGEGNNRPSQIAHIELASGSSKEMFYYLVSENQSRNNFWGNHENISIENEDMDYITSYLRRVLGYADENTTFKSIVLKCELDTYRQKLMFSILANYEDTEGDNNNDGILIGFLDGTLADGEFKLLNDDLNFNLFDNKNLFNSIKSDILSFVNERKKETLDFVKNNKSMILAEVRKKVYGYELAHTRDIGFDYAEREYRRRLNE